MSLITPVNSGPMPRPTILTTSTKTAEVNARRPAGTSDWAVATRGARNELGKICRYEADDEGESEVAAEILHHHERHGENRRQRRQPHVPTRVAAGQPSAAPMSTVR